mmetsp:Transcript_3391/g.5715  ORF Transcript_3391/g.5715 Transcript_3391/m.5715 type:complete len:92 (+) Transcript_3391:480-755(+)
MSRAKFDFSGYDPEAMRRKRDPSPEIKVSVKTEDDMDVYTGECLAAEGETRKDLEELNEESAKQARKRVNEVQKDEDGDENEQQIQLILEQ